MRKKDVQEFALNLENNLFQLHADLQSKSYRHGHYTSFFVNDPKRRHIHKASVRDRIVHHAVYRILYPIFDKGFIYDSYSCRNEKGTHKAVKRLEVFIRKASRNYIRPCFVLKCDVRKFFDSIDHLILLDLIKKKIKDENTLWLIEEIINSFCVEMLHRNVFARKHKYGLKNVISDPIGDSEQQKYDIYNVLDPRFREDDNSERERERAKESRSAISPASFSLISI